MYPRNAASPPRISIGAVVQFSDGAVQSAGVSVVVRPEGGSETSSGGTVAYGATTNIVYYTPTQAETNYTAFVVTAYKSGCIPVSTNVVTTASSTAGKVDLVDAPNSTAVTAIQSGLSTYDGSDTSGGDDTLVETISGEGDVPGQPERGRSGLFCNQMFPQSISQHRDAI